MRRQLRFVGVGGQGVILAGEILAAAKIQEGGYGVKASTYTSQVRGGPTKVDILLDNDEILFPYAIDGEIEFMLATAQVSFDQFKDGYESYISLRDIKKKYDLLYDEYLQLKIKVSITNACRSELSRLKEAIHFKSRYLSLDLIPLKQLQSRFDKQFNYLIAQNITDEPLKKDLGVISEYGVVGIIASVSQSQVKILPITHPKSSIPVWVGKQKILAFVSGNQEQNDLILKLKYVEEESQIAVGDRIVTNGYGGIFPEGINIGVVKEIYKEKNSLFATVEISLSKPIDYLKYFYVVKR